MLGNVEGQTVHSQGYLHPVKWKRNMLLSSNILLQLDLCQHPDITEHTLTNIQKIHILDMLHIYM